MPHLSLPNNAQLYYETHGDFPADSPTLLLFNGLSQSTANWMTQARRLSQSIRVVAHDARGQGRSTLGSEPLSMDVFARDIIALLDHLNIQRAHLCGFSYGAGLALSFAARHPERTDRLILTSKGATSDPLRRLIVQSWSRILDLGGLEAMTWAALPHILGPKFLEQYERQIPAMIKAAKQRNSREGLRALLDAMATFPDPGTIAPNVQAPTLVLASSQDPLVHPDESRALAGLFPDARYEITDTCGHTVPIEAAAWWRQHVLQFLSLV